MPTKSLIARSRSGLARRLPGLADRYRQYLKNRNADKNVGLPLNHLETLSDELPDVFCVGVGAMDGVSQDHLHGFLTRSGWRALLVEPLPDLFEELAETYRGYGGIILENVAIADEPGERAMYRVNPDAVANGAVPPWAKGISTFYRDRNPIGGKRVLPADWERIRPHVIEQTVRSDTLPNLLAKHSIDRIDVFQVDTEGHDYHVLKQLAFRNYRPRQIRIEWFNLPAPDKLRALILLRRNGYRTSLVREHGALDLVAWPADKPARAVRP